MTSYELEHIFNLVTSKLMYRLYRGKASRETALLLGLLTARGALTYRSRGLFDDEDTEGIFAEREDLHRVMRKLERLGIVTKSLQTPFRGGKAFALWVVPWASDGDIQIAIEEHNASLENSRSWSQIPAPSVPDEALLLDLSAQERDYYRKYPNELKRLKEKGGEPHGQEAHR